jgi:hypothetical protein
MPGVGIFKVPVFNNTLTINWRTRTDLVLFYGEIINIVGGQLNNEMAGAADHLDVAGIAGAYTFECPNTAPYINADSDFIWFELGGTLRTVTEAELVGYDLQRTPVRYEDVIDYSIEAIMILKSGVVLTGHKLNMLFDFMNLSLWWNGIFNDYGHLKQNRIGQQLWNPYTNAEALALVNRMIAAGETPTAARAGLIDNTFTAAKTKAFYAKLDALWICAGHGEASSKMNWLDNDHNVSDAIGNPSFTIDRGFTYSANNALKHDFLINTDKVNLSQNSMAFGIYCRTSHAGANACAMSAEGASYGLFLYLRFTDNICYNKCNSVTNAGGGLVANTQGMWICSRVAASGAASVNTYQHGILYKAYNSTSQVIDDVELHSGCRNVNGTLSLYDTIEQSLIFIAAGFDATDAADFETVFVTGYLTSVGAKV